MDDHNLKAKWASAHQRALRASRILPKGQTMVESPLASSLQVDVGSSLTEAELKAKILAREEKHPGFMVASYKGCCLVELHSGFPRWYKKVLGSMLTEAQKKSLQRQARKKKLWKEAMSYVCIQRAIEIFKPTKVEVRPLRASPKRRHRNWRSMGSFQST